MRDVYRVWDCVLDIDSNTTSVSVSVPAANRIDRNEQFIFGDCTIQPFFTRMKQVTRQTVKDRKKPRLKIQLRVIKSTDRYSNFCTTSPKVSKVLFSY